jgi:hypothetical protein
MPRVASPGIADVDDVTTQGRHTAYETDLDC